LLFLSAARDVPDSGVRLAVDQVLIEGSAGSGIGTCTAAGTDNLAYGFTGYKLPNSAMAYKIKSASFPTYLAASEVTTAITTSFAAWDAATSKALFTNGGTTTVAVNKKDGINTVGFASMSSGTVGMAYAWYNSKTKAIIEFDLALSTGYQWATNTTASGDCGGAADKFDVRNIIMHEIGHPTGLTDKSSSGDHAQTMHGYAAYAELYKRDLGEGDKKGLTTTSADGTTYLYGP
jgi:hypothetical protein